MLIAPLALLLALSDSPTSRRTGSGGARCPASSRRCSGRCRRADAAEPAAEPASAVAAPGRQGGPAIPEGLPFVWRDHPSLRAGKWLRLDFGVKLQGTADRSGRRSRGLRRGAVLARPLRHRRRTVQGHPVQHRARLHVAEHRRGQGEREEREDAVARPVDRAEGRPTGSRCAAAASRSRSASTS